MLVLGTVINGYCSRLARTVYLGRLSPEFQSVYQIVRDAQQRALDGIRAGMPTRAADALARSFIESAGYGSRFGHGLGHSLGLDPHEPPDLHPQDPDTLRPNMVLTVEPGICLRGSFGVRLGDVIRVTDDCCELLSHSPRALRIL